MTLQLAKKVLNDMCTARDNRSYDHTRIICIISFLLFYILCIFSYIILKHEFKPYEYAEAVGFMTACFGLNLKLKEKGEPVTQCENCGPASEVPE